MDLIKIVKYEMTDFAGGKTNDENDNGDTTDHDDDDDDDADDDSPTLAVSPNCLG